MKYSVEFDDDLGFYFVFNEVGYCKASFIDEGEAKEYCDALNQQRGQEIDMKALELATKLEVFAAMDGGDLQDVADAATELRRLAEVNAELLGALEYWVPINGPLQHQNDAPSMAHREKWYKTRALIAKAKEQQ